MTNAMTCEQFEALVPRLLEDEIEMTAAMRVHADGCESCRSLLADLRSIQAEAASLPVLAPERDLWSGVANQIEAKVIDLSSRRGPRHISLRVAGIAAAALVLVSTVVTYRMTRLSPSDTAAAPGSTPAKTALPDVATQAPPSSSDPRGQSIPTSGTSHVVFSSNPLTPVDNQDREIKRLRAIVDSGRTRLDPATVALLERNLGVIDTAIVQCRRALAKDPASRFLQESLNGAYQNKVKLLKIAAAASAG